MSIRVKSFLKDVGGAGRVTEARREKLKNASAVPDPKDPIRDLADKLHPSEMQLRVTDIRDASPTAKTFRFEAVDGHIPVFQCGQFVNFRLKIGESLLTRPYTISSAPYEARGEHPFFEITVRRNVPYLVPDYFFENVHVGDVLTGALPFGTFYWEPLRDTTELVALAGGSGMVTGIFFGSIMMGLLTNGMNLMRISSNWQWVVRGVLLIAVPSERHLLGLKEILYESPYVNEETDTEYQGFDFLERIPLRGTITITDPEQIANLFSMTPYYWKTPQAGCERLRQTTRLKTEIGFDLLLYRRHQA